jgi:hypothetical protein
MVMNSAKRSFAINNTAKPGPTFTLNDFEHTPMNRRHGEVKATGKIAIQDYDGTLENKSAWLSICLSEIVHHESGRSVMREISVSLDPDARKALIDLLSERAR